MEGSRIQEVSKRLQKIFGRERFSVEPLEIRLYERDLAPLPSLMTSLFKTTPSVVVQPTSTEEVREVVELSKSYGIPVTPRGSASYGFGGALATRDGMVVDMRRMNRIIELNRKQRTVTVEAGITWKKLIEYLERRGFTVLAYPSSAISATVGGWIATGGYGYGSLRYGHLSRHVERLEVVLPSARIVRSPSSRYPQELFMGTEGTYGIITRVTIRVRTLPKATIALLASFPDDDTLFSFVQRLNRLPGIPTPYTVIFYDSRFVALKNEVGAKLEPRPHALVRFEGGRDEIKNGRQILSRLAKELGGREEGLAKAKEEWRERFYALKIRKLGPTLIGTELIIPTDKLSSYREAMEKAAKGHAQAICYEGVAVHPSKVILLPMILSDERRKISHLMSMSLFKILNDAAVDVGGAPYGLGIWNSFYINHLWGREKARRLRERKKKVDARGLMNPDKVFGAITRFGFPVSRQLYSIGIGLFRTLSPFQSLSRIIEKKTPRVLSDVVEDLYICARCGYCNPVCPIFDELGWESASPRGRLYHLKYSLEEDKPLLPRSIVKRFYQCALCGRCKEYCVTGLELLEDWYLLRRRIAESGLAPEVIYELENTLRENFNIVGMPPKARTDWISLRSRWNKRSLKRSRGVKYVELLERDLVKRRAETAYFIGCLGTYYGRNAGIPDAMVHILHEAGEDFSILGRDEWCCGEPFLMSGCVEEFERFAQHNVDVVVKLGAKRVVFTCPGCYRAFKVEYPKLLGEPLNFEVVHSSELLSEYFKEGVLRAPRVRRHPLRVTYHDPCELGRVIGLYEEPRNTLKSLDLRLIEMPENRENALCCGGGGLLKVVDLGLSHSVAASRLEQAKAVGAETVASGCPACKMTLSEVSLARGEGLEVLDIVEIVARQLRLLP
ncbi:MAG: FAD-binding and (Fe-S)-binding domain-containing protein [Candidatus Bathyarchaeia archaeon]